MPSREPSRKKQQTQLQRIKKAHAKRAASRTLVREGGSAKRGSGRTSKRGATKGSREQPGGRFVVRKRSSGRLGGVLYEVTRYSRTKTSVGGEPAPAILGGPREASVPHGGLFTLGDPTLAKRVEEEIYRSEAR